MSNRSVRMSVLGACVVLAALPLLGAAASAQEDVPLDGWVKAEAPTQVPLDGWTGSPHRTSGSHSTIASAPLDAWAAAEARPALLDGWVSAIAAGEKGTRAAAEGPQPSSSVSGSGGFQLEYAVAMITSVLVAGVGIFALRMRYASPQH